MSRQIRKSRMKLIFIFQFLCISFTAQSRELKASTGGFFNFQGGSSSGSTNYKSTSYNSPGSSYQFIYGYRPSSGFKFGAFGAFDELVFKTASSDLAKAHLSSYGGSLRIFFVPFIFFEGGGGMSQTRLEFASGASDQIANATFYYAGPGGEIYLGSTLAMEITFKVRNTMYQDSDFKNSSLVTYGAGLNFYF